MSPTSGYDWKILYFSSRLVGMYISSPSRNVIYSESGDTWEMRKLVLSTIHLFGVWCHARILFGCLFIYSSIISHVVSSGESSPIRSSQESKDCKRRDSIVSLIYFSWWYVVVMMENNCNLFDTITHDYTEFYSIFNPEKYIEKLIHELLVLFSIQYSLHIA